MVQLLQMPNSFRIPPTVVGGLFIPAFIRRERTIHQLPLMVLVPCRLIGSISHELPLVALCRQSEWSLFDEAESQPIADELGGRFDAKCLHHLILVRLSRPRRDV